MEGIVVDVAIGIATSVVGGMILASMGFSRPTRGPGIVGCAVGVVSIVVGVLLGIVLFRTLARPVGILVSGGPIQAPSELAVLLAGAVSVAMGVFATVMMYRRIMSEL